VSAKGLTKQETSNMSSIGIKIQREMKAKHGIPTVAEIRDMVAVREEAQNRALIAIYNGQTQQEKVSQTTVEDNGIGFSGVDAEILTSFAEQFLRRQFLSPKQRAILAKKMPKYAGQLWQIAVSKKGVTATVVAAPVDAAADAVKTLERQIGDLHEELALAHEAMMDCGEDPNGQAYIQSLQDDLRAKDAALRAITDTTPPAVKDRNREIETRLARCSAIRDEQKDADKSHYLFLEVEHDRLTTEIATLVAEIARGG
jgi:hypothetical protein